MKKFYLIIWLLFAISLKASAQQVSFYGEVRDSVESPVAFANVVALNPENQTIASFGVSSGEGKFKLNLKQGESYLLRVSYLGFAPYEREIQALENAKDPLIVHLEATALELDAAEVVYEMPVTMRGDTLIYKADAFVNGRERKLKDVLEKLPGFEVDENGEVKVQGQKVNKLMVDGKDFFDGDTKMGTKNIPANAVDRVQVLKNFNEVAPMRGLDNDDNLALNIELKEGKKNMVFGDLTAGGGPEHRYLGHVNAFYYSPKLSLNLIADANNVGELAFTMQDYFRFSGGLSGLASRSGGTVSLTSDDIGIPMAQRNNAVDLQTKLGALNFNYRPDQKWMHSGFVIGSHTNNRLASISQRTYLRTEENNQEILTSSNNVGQQSGLFKYSATYTPRAETHVKYSAFGKLAQINNQNLQQSRFADFENSIQNGLRQLPYSLEQQLQAFYTPQEKHVFSFESGFQVKMQDPLVDLLTTQSPFNGIIPVIDHELFQLFQFKEIFTRRQETLFNYYHILNPKNHLNFSLGNQWTGQSMDSRIEQVLAPNEVVKFDQDALLNAVGFDFQDYFAGISWKSRFKKLIFSPGANLHYFRLSEQQLGSDNLMERVMLLPNLYAKYQFRNTQSLTFNFKTEANFMDVQQVAEGIVIRDYNALFAGNRGLENGLYQQYQLNYTHHNMFSAYTVFGNLNYQRRLNDIAPTVDFIGLDRINSVVNVEPINESFTGMLQGDKRFDKFRIRGSANMTALSTHNFVNEVANQNRSFTHNYTATFLTTLLTKFDLEAGYALTYNSYRSDQVQNSFVNERPFVKIHYSILKSLMLSADYEYNRYRNKATMTDSTFDFLNVYLAYQKSGSPWEFKTSLFNALNTRSIQRDSFNESMISTFEYFVQKRYMLVTVKYDL
ncbi:carboxypeptidase regulatory-like domain-containing protein [Litoribacter populi]|uniref:carboxypeptidase regulatory-like domain-containing protein n=1 Tax=Litoribacter populi TaxID=2598460 RepID=UPI00117D35D2|nr:carboxypeptidase regulatory-like domain-containing protein [Litoribacter populi]